MNQAQPHPQLFKGIALFTPGGDLVYCIDPTKQTRWHIQLCATLQEVLGLPEPPHFLVPCYAATIDRWIHPQTQQVCTAAEASPLVLRYQPLLNAVFRANDATWTAASFRPELCDPLVLAAYRQQFPQLWENHDLAIRLAPTTPIETSDRSARLSWAPATAPTSSQGYVLRLFVSGHSAATAQILQNLHQLLETSLQQPYTLKVVDVYRHPEQAEADHVTATPTLVKAYPPPVRRLAGGLDDANKVLQILSVSGTEAIDA